jgi:hypothetical protein
MKKITLLLAFIACVVFAQAQFIVNENFDYTLGDQLKTHGWVGTGTSPSTVNPILITTPTITYAGYPGSGTGNEVSLVTSGEDLNKAFTAVNSGTLYYSALINVTSAQATGDYFLHIGDVSTGSTFFGRIFIKQKIGTSNLAFGILKTSGGTSVQNAAFSDSIYSLNTTYLLVAKVEVSTGNSSLIINPTISSTEPTSGWLTSTLGTTALPTAGFGTVNLRQGSATLAAALKVDGTKVATSCGALFTGAGTITPSADVLNISLVGRNLSVSNATSNTVEIFNTVGAKVQSSKLESGSVQLNDLSQGLYVVRVGKQTAKIVL